MYDVVLKYMGLARSSLGISFQKGRSGRRRSRSGNGRRTLAMEEVEEELLWEKEEGSEPESIVSVTLARAMSILLSSSPRKLHGAISRLSSTAAKHSLGSIEDSLRFLHKYLKDAAEKKDSIDHVLVPMVENTLRGKFWKYGCQGMILINWIFQDQYLFEVTAENLASIIRRKEDRYFALGWCILLRHLVDYEVSTDQYACNGLMERYDDLLRILCSCLPHLVRIVCQGSSLLDGFELPSRLAVSAADCFLALTEALTKKAEFQCDKSKSTASRSIKPIASVPADVGDTKVCKYHLLWNHLEELIILVQKLFTWSKKSRFLHAKGLEQVLEWLQEIKQYYANLQDEADSKLLQGGVTLLASCWKHYSMLMHLEDQRFSQHFKELLDQYLSGIQCFTGNHIEGHIHNKSGAETRKFFLNCLCLLLGRLDCKRFDSLVLEYKTQISTIILPQLQFADEGVLVGVVSLLKAMILKPNCSTGSEVSDYGHVDALLPFLLNFLDERDGTAQAIVMLIAEYCAMSGDLHCLKEVLKHFASGNLMQRRNAMDVLWEVVHISSDSSKDFPHLPWQDIANHLLERLGDEEVVIREQASKLLPMIDPMLFLRALVGLICSTDEHVQSVASEAFVRVLKYNNQKVELICLVLDCLCNLSQCLDIHKTTGDNGMKLDTERVFEFIPEWSKSVQNWDCLIGPLIEKMFAEPSNATIVRFLSCISEHLANASDVVLDHVLLHVKGQKEINKFFFPRWDSGTCGSDNSAEMQQALFEHLCPLLVVKMLPLNIFNDVNSSKIYGHLTRDIKLGTRDIDMGNECIAGLLLNRAFHGFEFEDVLKLAAELCGRIHPQVLFPILCSQLEQATGCQDILKIKACLLSTCTSLVIRGWDSLIHHGMLKIRELIETVLLWPSLDGDPVSKAQHGCIDCLALMICAELQAKGPLKGTSLEKTGVIENQVYSASEISVLTYVISQFTYVKDDISSTSKLESVPPVFEPRKPLSFYICMGNVLISTCQKISEAAKKRFAQRTLPHLIRSFEVIRMPEIRTTCIQVLFSSVYHLRSAVLPHSSEIVRVALKALKMETEKERMAAAKLIASLLASEDEILETISGELLQVRSALLSMSLQDPSYELRQISQNLLGCMSSA